MDVYHYKIINNEAVNRWWLSEISAQPFRSPSGRFQGHINYSEGYVDYIYPVRDSFLKANSIADVGAEHYRQAALKSLYLPYGNNRVEGTDFFHKPMHLSFVGETYLLVEETCKLKFDLYTCGGVKLWVEDELVETFTPYTRNTPSHKSIELNLKQGLNRLNIYTDDLAERDVMFMFELRYRDDAPLIGALQLEEPVANLTAAEAFLSNCHFEEEVFYQGDMTLQCKPGLLDRSIQAQVTSSMDDTNRMKIDTVTLSPTSSEIVIDHVDALAVGWYSIEVALKLATMTVHRRFEVGNYPRKLLTISRGQSIADRKKEALKGIASFGRDRKNAVIALLALEQKMTPEIKALLEDILTNVHQKADGSVISIGSLLMIRDRYASLIGPGLLDKIEAAVLGYRYWVDEEGNDTMWYFSETHALHFHIAQYLAGTSYEDGLFTASNSRGRQQAVLGKKRLMAWFDHFINYGYGDWNSISHMPLNILGCLYLYELALDEEVKAAAIQCLEFSFRQIAYHSHKGLLSSTFGRAYERQLRGRELTEASFLSWISSGHGYINHNIRAVSVYAVSSFEPEDVSFEVQVADNEGVVIELNQGVQARALYSYKTKDYMMSSIQNFPMWSKGHQQHMMNIAIGEGVQCFINHPGERFVGGLGRPGYWAGNGSTPMIRQYRNMMLMAYKIPEDAIVDYIHLYLPEISLDQVLMTDYGVMARAGDAYLAIKFSQGVRRQTIGPTVGKEYLVQGREHKVYIKCSNASLWPDFDVFVKRMAELELTIDEEGTLMVDDLEYGRVEMDCHGQMLVNKLPVPIYKANEVLIERSRHEALVLDEAIQ